VDGLRDALEHENTAREVANCDISVASQWMIISGTERCTGDQRDWTPVQREARPLSRTLAILEVTIFQG